MNNDGCKGMSQNLRPIDLFFIGWKLLFSEISWFLKSRFSLWEIRQLKKRLVLEKTRLGHLIMDMAARTGSLDVKNEQLSLALGQADLLREEIIHLKKELSVRRKIFIEKRRYKYLQNRQG
ncbi:MAG: hypothetical protein ABR542_05505 [Desulfonatronovibrio sp.]